jgi:hypothetical protein
MKRNQVYHSLLQFYNGHVKIKGTLKELCGDVVLSIASISRLRRSYNGYRCAFKSAIIFGRMVNNINKSI